MIRFPPNLAIKSPQLKTREFAKLTLKNGVKCVLISDPATPVAAASIAVQSGSWNDSPSHQGIAHFCEHMLFLGSKTYPEENEYHRFIQDNNGVFNAYTASDHTIYYFSGLVPSALKPALSRLSKFFHEPLFSPGCSDRERHAVHEEFKKNIQQDGWQALKLISGESTMY